MGEINQSSSPVIFVYGMTLILGAGKACMLLIWRNLPRSRPGLWQEVREARQRWTRRKSDREAAAHASGDSNPATLMHAPAAQDGLPQP
jgi:hypothetical protein